MEVDLVPSGIEEEGAFGVNQNYSNDSSNFEVETCGICMDTIIDRGVLDCCQHWFCFACIDNWASITNLCPLCQNEFQLITCVPVYDTIGSSKVEEDSSSRVDDWCIEGQNNSLSFPSYYIDENAVVCLSGEGCKIRSGAVNVGEDSNLDTSIACDSCDLWYHAFCVGFDTEGTCESTWLCPRCVFDEAPKNLDADSSNSQYGPESAIGQSLVEVNSSRYLSVSVADSGETALVVSVVGENEGIGEPTGSVLATLEVCKDPGSQTLLSASENSHKVEKPSEQRNINQPVLGAQELALTLSCDTFSLHSNSLPQKQSRMSICGSTNELDSFDGMRNTSGKAFSESHVNSKQSDSDSTMGLHLGLSVGSFLSDQDIEAVKQHNPSEDYVSKADMLVPKHEPEDWKQHNPLEDNLPRADNIVTDANSDAPGITGGEKRKRTDCSDDIADNGDFNAKIETKVPVQKIGDGEKIQPIASTSGDQAKTSVPDDSKRFSSPIAVPKDSRSTFHPVEDNTTSDKIVRATIRKSSKGLKRPNPADKTSQEQDLAGLRVKKIMRRAAEDKESSVVVQTLREEIREAVSNKSLKGVGKNLFDPKLLDAFRAAVAGPKTEPAKKLSHLALKANKAVLQKGKIRENLTKKIYASSNGRRKRAWDRDCEIEFWKHRCIGTTEPEKIKTLKSVLDLLKGRSEGADAEESDRQPTNPILSRLYLADTSLLPRNEDIKPLLALKTSGSSEKNDKQLTSREKFAKSSFNGSASKSTEPNKFTLKVGAPLLETHGVKSSAPSSENNAASTKVREDRHSEGSLVSSSGASKSITKKELVDKIEDVKSDKRKWALQILARKMSAAGGNATNEKQEDKAMLKGNYPLLVQLPVDMRPVLAPSRHNKIPLSVRQTQLYRLTEHLLRKANLVVIRRNADTELAVADAINIEKEVAERSNSKQVYLNLCSQKLLHRAENSNSSGTPVISTPPSSVPTDRSEQAANELSTDPVTEAALRNAGLLSDSPPNSPQSNVDFPAGEPSRDIKEEGPDNVFDMEFNPDLDIYGDFEYNLEDEDYIGVTATKVSNPQPEEGASKLKLVFSTLQPESSNHTLDLENADETVAVRKDSCDMLENYTDSGLEHSTTEVGTDKSGVPLESLYGKEGQELSVAECEELYGPDKEPLLQEFPGVSGSIDEALVEDKYPIENGNHVPKPNQAIETSDFGNEKNNGQNMPVAGVDCNTGVKDSTNHPQPGGNIESKEKKSSADSNNQSKSNNSISKKVEAYIKEHLRPLCKSGVITVEQYKWAVAKTTDKVMKYHSKAKTASFLIKEGEKVKKLAEQYVETAQQKDESDSL